MDAKAADPQEKCGAANTRDDVGIQGQLWVPQRNNQQDQAGRRPQDGCWDTQRLVSIQVERSAYQKIDHLGGRCVIDEGVPEEWTVHTYTS